MKELLTLGGGYPRQMDFILNLQTEMLAMGNSMLGSFGFDFVLSGCAVVDNGNGTINVTPGFVYIAGEVLRYDGDNNLASDSSLAFYKGGYIATDMRLFGDGSNKNVYREAKAGIQNATPTNTTELKVKPVLYNVKEYIKDTVLASEPKGTIKEMYDLDGTLLANFDDSGLGITPRWIGWARDNGNYSPGSAGMVLVGSGTYTDSLTGEETEFVEGDGGGEIMHKLTVGELPKHNAKIPTATNTTPPGGNPAGVTFPYIRTTTVNSDIIGNDEPHNNMQPWRGVHRFVKIVDTTI